MKTYKCSICDKKFNKSNQLGGHMTTHYRFVGMRGGSKKAGICTCKNCDKSFEGEISGNRPRVFCSLKCNGEFRKKQSIKIVFNKTSEFLLQYRENQNTCEICGEKEKIKVNGKTIKLAFDHDHNTNEFRGMLCFMCNTRYDWYLKNMENIVSYSNKILP